MIKPLYIFDLDGTLAIIEHRLRYVECPREEQNWEAFFAACGDDCPNAPVTKTMELLYDAGADVWIFTGRSDKVRSQTIQWLAENTNLTLLHSSKSILFMRPPNDHTPDADLKRRWLSEMPAIDRDRLVAVFEDRNWMAKMWRSEGVPCFQVSGIE